MPPVEGFATGQTTARTLAAAVTCHGSFIQP
jgi:hypothetical protein